MLAPCARVHRDHPQPQLAPGDSAARGVPRRRQGAQAHAANLSSWDPQLVEHFRVLLKGGVAVEPATSVLSIERALPHGHVAAVLGAARGSGSSAWFGSAPKELQPVLQAMLVARLLEPASKLATHRMLHDDTATSSLGRVLGVGQCDERNLLELTSQHFPGERLVVCRNPLLAEERARKRLELPAATEADLTKIAAATQRARNPLRGEQAIALRVGRVIERFHMAKHIALTITDTSFAWVRKEEAIAAEAALAKAKDASKHAEDGLPLHSFRTLLKDLATLTYNIARTAANPNATIAVTARPTPIQAKAFELLGLSPNCSQ